MTGIRVEWLTVPSRTPSLAALIHAHAEYERSSVRQPADEVLSRLDAWCREGRVELAGAFVGSELAGYASLTSDVATWTGEEFGHLDCLYVNEAHRGQMLGQQLVDAVVGRARVRGFRELQWQTPSWNTRAIRFYERIGATGTHKQRFRLEL
ncbi:ribosomal protein S18 acetylase RimI-like enzyme [Nocardioides thalensis]|uniref:Ribosomal protein S18 acetylase RimI-like enzyme n=1 Tax=Nocardioides thalensis TaxID=1914755 RepID=A0A853C5N3_9ACTN|nr:GNAT family N-acetyltransferase [Nocardioides thalensis]NYJ01982.1 ribosomal protein S18 acetylase RimI-like enzyme [Nocardioides thalensis]